MIKQALAAAAALALAIPALAQTAPAPEAPAGAQGPGAAQSGDAEAVGQIKAVDTKAGTVTIHHAPIAALGWPAMTMTFKAAPEALQAARPGQTVSFTMRTADDEVTAIRPQ